MPPYNALWTAEDVQARPRQRFDYAVSQAKEALAAAFKNPDCPFEDFLFYPHDENDPESSPRYLVKQVWLNRGIWSHEWTDVAGDVWQYERTDGQFPTDMATQMSSPGHISIETASSGGSSTYKPAMKYSPDELHMLFADDQESRHWLRERLEDLPKGNCEPMQRRTNCSRHSLSEWSYRDLPPRTKFERRYISPGDHHLTGNFCALTSRHQPIRWETGNEWHMPLPRDEPHEVHPLVWEQYSGHEHDKDIQSDHGSDSTDTSSISEADSFDLEDSDRDTEPVRFVRNLRLPRTSLKPLVMWRHDWACGRGGT